MNFGRAKRKSLFLSTTILRGRRLKDDNEQGGATSGNDGFDVGPGFAEAAQKMGSDDNRAPEQRGGGATQEIPDDSGGDNPEGNGDEGQQGNEPGEGDEGNEAEPKPRPKRKTAEYIRETKRELRETKGQLAQLQQRLAEIENGGLPRNQNDGNSPDTSGRPDPTDTEKYPLGVLDDGYTADLIEWTADQKVKAALSEIDQNKKASEATQRQLAHVAELQAKVDSLAEKGSEIFDDYEELVVEGAKAGDYALTETTFTAAAEAENGPTILYNLANDPAEAKRVAALTPFQQLKYVAEKDAEITAKKPKARTAPKAGTPPENLPRGRNASAPIRADTDNLDDFRKLLYGK